MFKKKFILIAIFIATFMTSIETTIVTTAMPTIISELHGLSIQSWVFAAYLLTTAITTPIYGKLSDRIGRKPIFLLGLVLFILGSFLCGFAPNMIFLIIFRVLQGLGAGAVQPLTFTIIADLFSFKERTKIFAMNNTAWAISALGGPLLGGYIVTFLNWHWIFFINVPLGIITILLTTYAYNEKKVERESKRTKIDFLGILFLTLTLFMLLLVFQGLSGQRINWFFEGLEALICLVSFVLFIIVERRAEDAVLQLNLFKNYSFSTQILTTFLLSGAIIAYQIYFPIWLQSIYRVPAYLAGVAITPSSVMWMIASFLVGSLLKKYSARHISLTLSVVLILIYIPIVLSGPSFPQFLFYFITGISGAAVGTVTTMNTLYSQDLVPKENVGLASSMIVLARTLGQALMTGVYGLAFSLGVNAGLKRFTNIQYNDINNFISTTANKTFDAAKELPLQTVTISALQKVFVVVIVLFIIAMIVNFFNKGTKEDKKLETKVS